MHSKSFVSEASMESVDVLFGPKLYVLYVALLAWTKSYPKLVAKSFESAEKVGTSSSSSSSFSSCTLLTMKCPLWIVDESLSLLGTSKMLPERMAFCMFWICIILSGVVGPWILSMAIPRFEGQVNLRQHTTRHTTKTSAAITDESSVESRFLHVNTQFDQSKCKKQSTSKVKGDSGGEITIQGKRLLLKL